MDPTKKASEFDQEVYDLFDEYVHGDVDRRGFLERVAKLAIGGMTAGMVLDALSPRFAEAEQVRGDDKRLVTSTVPFESPRGNGKMRAYLARPAKGPKKLPAVLVVHENRGLNPHIEDIARRVALAGYLALAPDALTPLGGYPGDEDKARELFGKLDRAKVNEDFVAAFQLLKKRPDATGKVGVVGFCFGGAVAGMLAVREPTLDAAVAFYGSQPTAEETARIKAPLLVHYAENDERVNAGAAAFQAALTANKVKHQVFKYPGTQHGFNNDTTPRHDKAAAALAWKRTMEFFAKNLK